MRAMRFLGSLLRTLPLLSVPLLSGCGDDSPSRSYDVTRYDLEGEYHWDEQRLEATVRVTIAPTEDDLSALELDSAVSVRAVRIAGVGDVNFESQPAAHVHVSLDDVETKKGEPIVLEIDYDAKPSDGLRPIPPREGDPLPVRAFFTDSEPDGVREWMPSNDVPSDRAIFSVKMRMAVGEAMIANGKLVSDATEGSSRRMHYETAYPLPPYLMAFAISDFEVEATKRGDLPVEIWHRRGLPGDHATMAAELSRMIGEMEARVGPYPFERYALVLLPGHLSSGMENAGITFQLETASTAATLSSDLRLAAHEIAHQWFGDLVTVETWDDVWIKEGMASLLEAELVREHLDRSSAGTLNGDELDMADGDAIRDPGKAPRWKYDSGPYDRAAWLFTQIRAIVGDEAFWGTLRGLLDARRMGVVNTEDVVQAFAPLLGAEGTARVRRAISAKKLPFMEVAFPINTEATIVTLRDPDGALVAPMEFEWITADGTRRGGELVVNEPVTFNGAADELLVLDPKDVHPLWDVFPGYDGALAGKQIPWTSASLARLLELPGVHQRNALALADGSGLSLTPEELSGFLGALDSDAAQAIALERACETAVEEAIDAVPPPPWVDGVMTAFATFSRPFGLDSVSSYGACSQVVSASALWPAEWGKLSNGLPDGDVSDERLVLLSKFGVPRETWEGVAMGAGTLRARRLAAATLPREMDEQAFFIELVKGTDASEVLRMATSGLYRSTRGWHAIAFENPEASARVADGIAAMSVVLQKDLARPAHANTLCYAYWLMLVPVAVIDASGNTILEYQIDQAAWNSFSASLVGAPLSKRAADIRQNPSLCN
jgi:aminopeptidase N